MGGEERPDSGRGRDIADDCTPASSSPTQEESLELRTIGLFNKLGHVLNKPFYETITSRFDITLTEWRVLVQIHRHPGITAHRISQITGMTAMNVSRAISSLRSRDRVSGMRDPRDSRRHLLETTPAGAELYREVHPNAARDARAVLTALNPDELAFLHALLERIARRGDSLFSDESVGPGPGHHRPE